MKYTNFQNQNIVIKKINFFEDILGILRLNPERYPYLLQSSAKGNVLCRYDILFSFPQKQIILNFEDIQKKNFLKELDKEWKKDKKKLKKNDNNFPFTGGWFVYLGYELVSQIENKIVSHKHRYNFPVAFASRIPAAIIKDNFNNETFIICEEKYKNLIKKIETDIKILLEKKKFLLKEKKIKNKILINSLIEEPPENHIKNINKILKYIKAGDVFQVNLSREWHGKINNKYTAWDIFSKLKKTNPSPFSGLVIYKNKAIISSSPERLIMVKNGHIETRPIAGTRSRGGSGIYDVALSQDLLNNKKERAEHIMLVDLERNDLSKVTIKGSVKVNELMIVESYAHVHHIVSNITGKIRENTTPGEIIEAVFPGGTITGCPKVRCMEILSEIEKTGRGPYTGSIGYINNDGSMDLNILIRTIVKDKNNVSIRAGGGIVADSIPKRELEEARAKAKGMINALI